MTDTTVYLAGPVAHADGGGAGWRETIQQFYGDEYDFRDPLSKYNVPADDLTLVEGRSHPDTPETVGTREIVEDDKTLLKESDAVLVGYSAVRSVGTPMEVMWAFERAYPIAVWVRDETPIADLSPWYRFHAGAITNDAEMALSHLDRATTAEEVRDE
jgi:nucleoside 2-deoxyribosyltransferase